MGNIYSMQGTLDAIFTRLGIDPQNPPAGTAFQNYVYTFNVGTLAGGGAASANINIEADSYFVWQATTYFVTADPAAGQTADTRIVPEVTMSLTDGGSGRRIFDTPQAISSFAGTGELPYILNMPYLFSKKSTLNADFVNLIAATAFANLAVSLHGFRIYAS